MGTTLEDRFVDYVTSKDAFPWNALSNVAADYAPLADELLTRLESRSDFRITTNVLRFLASARPKSLLLREECLRAMRGETGSGNSDDFAFVAAEILASQYRDDETLSELLALTSSGADGQRAATYGVALALADGWPEQAAVRSWKTQVTGRFLPWELYFALEERPDRIVHALREFCRLGGMVPSGTSRCVLKFCVRHVARCDHAFQLLLTGYLREFDDLLRVSMPIIVATARGVGILGRQQLVARLEREMSGRIEPHVGYDLRADAIHSEAVALMELLASGDG